MRNHSSILVSIYIPTKNRKELLKRALKSCLTQTHNNIEVIVVDDGSTDGTIEYLNNLSHVDKRVKMLANAVSLGACASRNRAIHIANGEFITGLDDDDYFTPNRIYNFLDAWPYKAKNTLALFSDSQFIFQNDRYKKTNRPKSVKAPCLIDSNLIGNQIFTKTSLLQRTDGFDTNLPAWQDLEYWYRILKIFPQGKFQKIGSVSYVVDASHPHERISNSKISNIEEAFIIFTKKHDLSNIERKILSLQLHMYQPNKNPTSRIFLKLQRKLSLRNIKSSLEALLKYIYSHKNL